MAEIRTEINLLWQKCGQQYFNENENELNKIELIDRCPINYPKDVVRPTLGCRAIVQRSLRVITIVLREMTDWKVEVRVHSLKLLWQIILHCEKAFTAKFFEIYSVLSKYCSDAEVEVAKEAIRVAKLTGMLLEYRSWIDHGIDGLEKSPHLGSLTCFYGLYSEALKVDKAKDVKKISKLLANPSICHSEKALYQKTLLQLLNVLVDLYLETDDASIDEQMNKITLSSECDAERHLYIVLVKVIALSESNGTIPEMGKDILIKLAKGSWELSTLHAQYCGKLIDSLEDLDSENSENSEPIVILHGIIWLCGYQSVYLDSMKMAIRTALDNAAPSGKIKIFSAISVVSLIFLY